MYFHEVEMTSSAPLEALMNFKKCLDQQISLILQRRLIDGFEAFTKNILESCKLTPSAGSIPLTVSCRTRAATFH